MKRSRLLLWVVSSLFAMPTHIHIDGLLALGFGLGLVLFFWGLSRFRRGLLVSDTPMIPIRSIAMGLTQIHGHASGEDPFTSPVGGTPCYAFRVIIERYERNGWVHQRTDQNGRRFFITDDSGRIRVDPLNAKFDVPRNCRRIVGDLPVGASLLGSVGLEGRESSNECDFSLDAKTDDQLLEYAGVGYGYSHALRFTEYCIEVDHEYDVVGTCVENPRPESDDDKNLITKGDHDHTFLISSKSSEQLKQEAGWRSSVMVFGGAALAVFCAALFMAIRGLL